MTEWTAEQQREHRKLWVEALRSGKYQQATSSLRTTSGMCCLGVACDISHLGAWDGDGAYRTHGGDFSAKILPKEVQSWLGLRHLGGNFGSEDQLTVLNDTGATFAKIADIIESEPAGLIAGAGMIAGRRVEA